MIPIILNTNFEKIGMIEDYTSFIWTARYYTPGDFEIAAPLNLQNLNFLRCNNYVMRETDENAGVIESVEFIQDSDGSEMIIAKGRFLSAILSRRIIADMTSINNLTVPNAIRKFINDAIITPSVSDRRINNFSFSDLSGATDRVTIQHTGTNLLEAVNDLCLTYKIGHKTLLNGGNFVFTLYSGVDRSLNQSVNPRVIFSRDYDNLNTSDYLVNCADKITDVLTAGEGEGSARKTAWAAKTTNAGLDRYEAYKDARNTSTDGGTISDTVYLDQLRAEGLESVTEYSEAFSGNVFFDNIKYRVDVNLGDIVTIINNDWGIGINTRIVEVIESVNESGEYEIMPTFGV